MEFLGVAGIGSIVGACKREPNQVEAVLTQWSFDKVSDIPKISDGYSWIGSSASSTGGALFLFVHNDAREKVRAQHFRESGIFPFSRMDKGVSFVLVHLNEDREQVFELHDVDVTFPLFDLFPNGNVLIAGTRSRWRSHTDFERNGLIIDPSSGDRSRILLGDGIEGLFVDTAGRIWVSYFDEGVFGNYGWGGPGPAPIGASGLNCFDQNGETIWSFPPEDKYGGIADCYALNVSGKEAWIYYYTEFPICRVSEKFQTKHWETSLAGCHNFALTKDRGLFSGQYDDSQSVAYLANFGDGEIGKPRKIELTLPDSVPIANGQLLGRGAAMHFFSAEGWFRTQVNEIDL